MRRKFQLALFFSMLMTFGLQITNSQGQENTLTTSVTVFPNALISFTYPQEWQVIPYSPTETLITNNTQIKEVNEDIDFEMFSSGTVFIIVEAPFGLFSTGAPSSAYQDATQLMEYYIDSDSTPLTDLTEVELGGKEAAMTHFNEDGVEGIWITLQLTENQVGMIFAGALEGEFEQFEDAVIEIARTLSFEQQPLSGTSTNIGNTMTGAIDPDKVVEFYEFSAERGKKALFLMNDNDIDITVIDEDYNNVTESGDRIRTYFIDERKILVTLPSTGTYWLAVSNTYFDVPDTTLNYEIVSQYITPEQEVAMYAFENYVSDFNDELGNPRSNPSAIHYRRERYSTLSANSRTASVQITAEIWNSELEIWVEHQLITSLRWIGGEWVADMSHAVLEITETGQSSIDERNK